MKDLRKADEFWQHPQNQDNGEMIRRDPLDRQDIVGGVKKNQYGQLLEKPNNYDSNLYAGHIQPKKEFRNIK